MAMSPSPSIVGWLRLALLPPDGQDLHAPGLPPFTVGSPPSIPPSFTGWPSGGQRAIAFPPGGTAPGPSSDQPPHPPLPTITGPRGTLSPSPALPNRTTNRCPASFTVGDTGRRCANAHGREMEPILIRRDRRPACSEHARPAPCAVLPAGRWGASPSQRKGAFDGQREAV